MFDQGRSAATTNLPPRPASARTARRFVANALQQWSLSELTDTTELLTGELVSNAVLHARCEFGLRVRRRADAPRDGIRVEVTDTSSELPERRDGGAEATGGRGLMLVEALATAWGVEPTDGGKVVWFEVCP